METERRPSEERGERGDGGGGVVKLICNLGDMEIPFTEFGATDVPFHRIRYYKKHTEVLWDRRKKIDNFFL